MRYTEIQLRYSFAKEWQQSIFEQMLADMGVETFLPIENGANAYIQTDCLQEDDLQQLIANTEGVELVALTACEDQNWNQGWEEEHQEFRIALPEREIMIHPHCAFGAGYHQTTSMMISELVAMGKKLKGKCVLDNGCGTGILGIVAATYGSRVVAVDIDDKSVVNAQENALLNGVEMDIRLGNTPPEGSYDVICSNIHRNVLVSQMSDYARCLRTGGRLIVSGFLSDDCEVIADEAHKNGLHLLSKQHSDEWYLIVFEK